MATTMDHLDELRRAITKTEAMRPDNPNRFKIVMTPAFAGEYEALVKKGPDWAIVPDPTPEQIAAMPAEMTFRALKIEIDANQTEPWKLVEIVKAA